MKGYRELRSHEDVDIIMKHCSDFHDCLLKEAFFVTDAYVAEDRAMITEFLGRLRILVQSQLKGATVEMVFAGIAELTIREPEKSEAGEIFDVLLDVSSKSKAEKRRWITFEMGDFFRVVARRAFWYPRGAWLGPDPRFGFEVPKPGVIDATPLADGRRRCESCQKIWKDHRILSTCPGCRQLTELTD